MDRLRVVRDIHGQWERGNWSAGAELLAADAVVSWQEPPQDVVECHGPEETAERLASFLRQWREFRVFPEQFDVLDGDTVLVRATQVNVGKASGVRIHRTIWIVWRFAGERVAQIRWNWDRATALRLAGLADTG